MDLGDLVHRDPFDKQRQHKCAIAGCLKAFTRQSDLKRHQKLHDNDRPFVCTYPSCRKQFIQKSALTVHARKHTGEKPHACEHDQCGRRFSDISSLARHRRIHMGKNTYPCQFPGCERKQKLTLINHVKHRHSPDDEGVVLAKASSRPMRARDKRSGIPMHHLIARPSALVPAVRDLPVHQHSYSEQSEAGRSMTTTPSLHGASLFSKASTSALSLRWAQTELLSDREVESGSFHELAFIISQDFQSLLHTKSQWAVTPVNDRRTLIPSCSSVLCPDPSLSFKPPLRCPLAPAL